MPVLLGFIHHHSSNNNSTSDNPSARSDITRPLNHLSKRRQNRPKSSSIGESTLKDSITSPSVQKATTVTSITKPHTLPPLGSSATPVCKSSSGPTVTELKITPPFPALRLSSFSLRSKSNPRTSRLSSRSPSPTADPALSPVLAPSPIITRTTSNGDGLLSSDTLCSSNYFTEDQEHDTKVTPSTRGEFWSQQGSESNSASVEPVQDTPRITISSYSASAMDGNTTAQYPNLNGSLQPSAITRSVSDSIVNFARRSWNSPAASRSSSPSSRDAVSTASSDSSTTDSSASSVSLKLSANGVTNMTTRNGRASRRGSISSTSKSPRRPLTMMFGRATASDTTVPMMKSASNSADISTSPLKLAGRRVKDELWDAFRNLESDYNRFQNKSSAQKASIIRSALIPFLRNSARITCNNIEPDELDKRVRVLHRWWTGLLAQLQNRSPTAIAGTDRPLYLEGISGIMSRPEWRPPQSEFSPISQQISKSQSSTSVSSDSSRYSVEKSVLHNVKSLFTRTVIDTLAFAVDKMSQRTAPASIVAFAGKVVAYAFFFCSGAAEVLISLWNIPAATLKRVVQQNGIQRGADLQRTFDDVVIGFPECLHSLGFANLSAALKQLKKQTKPPLGNTVDWYGAWVNRWLGRDTDLLFVFLKYYHILLCEFLPPDASRLSQICAPAFIFIQAHILNIMDATVHKQLQKPVTGANAPSLITFDDVLAKASPTFPVPVHRTMSENKLVVLLRDVLTDRQLCSPRCRGILSESFSAMLMATARRTRVFDSDACFTLCDMMEETFPILNYSEKMAGNGASYIDWAFWLDVFKKMSECDNNMTELRLICMIFMLWGLLVEEENRKRKLCVDWLLSPSTWERYFCHWCPMVRAYYMRLICWRLTRYNGGQASDLDNEILQTVSLRLRTCFAHHTRLKEKAEKGLIAPPSTIPCLPAPGRRLIILRNDSLIPPPGVFFAEDGLITYIEPPVTPAKPTTESGRDQHSITPKKKWSILRSLGFQPDSPSPPGSPESPSPITKTNGLASNIGDIEFPEVPASASVTQRKPTFKFSLEWMPQSPFTVRDKHLNPARLPASSQAYLDAQGLEATELVNLSDCTNLNTGRWTYSGRALAEWVLVVVEYENFFERRKNEGKESIQDVETPSLAVESLKKL
ncbi:hypothetical protein BDZ91DRAFT_796769 [Kalaharituber pfeilii]|nr:hypothetical protein BDZ91DRAFT_796769 [Kalaharituber pfeilii]